MVIVAAQGVYVQPVGCDVNWIGTGWRIETGVGAVPGAYPISTVGRFPREWALGGIGAASIFPRITRPGECGEQEPRVRRKRGEDGGTVPSCGEGVETFAVVLYSRGLPRVARGGSIPRSLAMAQRMESLLARCAVGAKIKDRLDFRRLTGFTSVIYRVSIFPLRWFQRLYYDVRARL